MLRDRFYYTTLFRLALPIIAQNFFTSSLNVIDIAMIGQMGETAVASVGLANQVFFLLILMLFGTYGGVGVFSSQLWGKEDLSGVRKVQGIGLIIGLTGSAIFMLLALVIPRAVISLYTTDPNVISAGSEYLRTVGWCYMIIAITFAYSSVLRNTGYVRVPMIVSIIALSLKTALNYGLIFGNFGMPELGIQGAAIATVIARLIECGLLLAVTYWRKLPAAARISELFGFNRVFLMRVLKTSLPVVANELLWSFGITTYNMVYGHIGTDALASVNIAASIENLAFVIFMGISESTGIMIGNRIGAGEEHRAFGFARQSIIMATAGAILVGIGILVSSDYILSFYNLSEVSRANAHSLLTVMGFALWVRVSNMILIVGVLRAGGDTRFSMFLDAGTVWLVGVPLAVIGGLVLHLPVYIVYLLVMAEEAVKYCVALWRFFSRRWINNLVQVFAG